MSDIAHSRKECREIVRVSWSWNTPTNCGHDRECLINGLFGIGLFLCSWWEKFTHCTASLISVGRVIWTPSSFATRLMRRIHLLQRSMSSCPSSQCGPMANQPIHCSHPPLICCRYRCDVISYRAIACFKVYSGFFMFPPRARGYREE